MNHFHEIQPGECFASVSKLYGFKNMETLYEHPRNAELKRRRPNPFVLLPGDRVFIPQIDLKEVEAATEEQHVFQVRLSPVYLRLLIRDLEGRPCTLKRYELSLGRQIRAGHTDASGFIKERIDVETENAELTVWFDAEDVNRCYRWKLNIGHLDPVEEMTGVQARLNNLGYFCGAIDGRMTPETAASIRNFQREHDLQETGEVDEALRAKLSELHRC